ncbi:MAG TPA: type II toxin-antitoxin system PemK/MazF family toxin [Ilumatobacteraceae bacterium]|nr:type II toxin-antitoxin system PemK/MazF family toxin [Ilumatobacteraceae bacterium]
MKRGDLWLAEVGNKPRPVAVLTRSQVLDVRALVTVAEITTSVRSIAAEVPLDHRQVGLSGDSAINCDGIHTVAQTRLTKHLGVVDDETMRQVCAALHYALDC